jgi:creatinine amidohydrolase
MESELSTDVQMQLMRPGQLEAAIERFPVVYVPFGLIEWHGRHLPVGTDALKAHAILVKCAEAVGGVVYPPVYFPYAEYVEGTDDLLEEDGRNFKIPFLEALFGRLRAMGFRAIIGVSGHNVPQQRAWIDAALRSVTADGTVAGVGSWEVEWPSADPDSGTDHAAKWETSDIMFFHPELVSLDALGDEPLALDMRPPDGIAGLDPREHASAAVGRRNVKIAVARLGATARALLDSLPPTERGFRLPSLSPEHWWLV